MLYTEGGEQLVALGKRFNSSGKPGGKYRAELRKAIRKAAKPAINDVKRAIKAIPIRGEKSARGGGYKQRQAHRTIKTHRGLRGRIASATGLQYKDGPRSAAVKIRINSSALPKDQRTLPRRLDSLEGWRHPLFGNKKHWYAQRGQPYWEVTLRKHGPKVLHDVIEAMETTAKHIAEG